MLLIAPDMFPYTLMGLAANFLLCQLLMPIIGLKARKMAFTPEFMSQFEQEHKDAMGGGKPDGIAQPDQGTGWYSRKLPLAQWVRLMSAQRIIFNYIESFPTMIMFTVISSLYFPIPALVGIWGTLLGRLIFVVGYKKSPPLRKPGMMLIMFCQAMMAILSMTTAVMYLSDSMP